MKITVFTSNQPRHIALICSLAGIAEEVFAIQECNTVFPGKLQDFYNKSDVMQEYFSHMIAAEKVVFGEVCFSPKNVHTLSIKSGDLNRIEVSVLARALSSDIYIVFGASYIKGKLVDFLVTNQAINIHMGVSPYYRGSSCNFWALYDGNPDLVGATIHRLSRGLDSGGMLFHALPKPLASEPFLFGMRAVRAAQESLLDSITSGEIWELNPVDQDNKMEIRYTRNSDFNDEVARNYLARNWTASEIGAMLKGAPRRVLVKPHYR